MKEFQTASDLVDESMVTVRELYESNQFDEAKRTADQVTSQIQKGRQLLNKVNVEFNRANDLGLNLFAAYSILNKYPELSAYLAMQRNIRFGNGSSFEHLVRTWRGLEFGRKSWKIPTRRKSTMNIAGAWLNKDSSLIIILNNGGLVRGVIEGWTLNDDLILNEVLPMAFSKLQKSDGHLRIIPVADLTKIARLEVFLYADPLTEFGIRPGVTDRMGKYGDSVLSKNIKRVERVDLRQDDMELLEAARTQKLGALPRETSVTEIHPDPLQEPKYARVFYFDCEAQLSNTVRLR